MVSLLFRGPDEQLHIPLDADDEDQLGLSRDVGRVILLGNAVKADLLALLVAVLLDVLLSTLEDDAALLLVGLNKAVSLSCHMCAEKVMCIRQVSDPKEGIRSTASTLSS